MFLMDLKGNYRAYWKVDVCIYVYTVVQGMYEDLVQNLSIPTCLSDHFGQTRNICGQNRRWCIPCSPSMKLENDHNSGDHLYNTQ